MILEELLEQNPQKRGFFRLRAAGDERRVKLRLETQVVGLDGEQAILFGDVLWLALLTADN